VKTPMTWWESIAVAAVVWGGVPLLIFFITKSKFAQRVLLRLAYWLGLVGSLLLVGFVNDGVESVWRRWVVGGCDHIHRLLRVVARRKKTGQELRRLSGGQ